MPQRQPKTVVDLHQQMQINDLHKEISLIKDNHLAHIAQDIDNLSAELKDTKETFDKRFDKLDERLWLVIGLVITTLVGIVVSGIM